MQDSSLRHLPNILTVTRLVLAAGFFLALNQYRFPDVNTFWANAAIVLFMLAAASDWADGFLARRWGVESVFGRIMDPFCDKVLVLGAFIYLAGPRFVIPERAAAGDFVMMATGVYSWMVVVVIARELLVTSVRGLLESMGESGGAQWAGKWKMVLQSVTIPIVILIAVNLDPTQPENAWAAWTRDILVYATVIVTILSGVPYVTGLRAVLRKQPTGGGDVSG